MIFIVFIWFIFHIRQGSPSYNCHSIGEVTLNGLGRTGMYQPQHTRTLHISLGYNMMTSSNGNIFRVTGHLCGEFTGPGEFPAQRPVTRSFDVFFDLHPNKRLSKQWWGWWFETPSRPLWRHSNDLYVFSARPQTSWVNSLRPSDAYMRR